MTDEPVTDAAEPSNVTPIFRRSIRNTEGRSRSPAELDAADVLSMRLTQSGAILHALRCSLSGEGSVPSNVVVGDSLWAVNDLLDQAEEAFDILSERRAKS